MPRALCQADPEVGQPDRQAAGWVDGQGRGWKGKHGPAGKCRTRQSRCHHQGVEVLGELDSRDTTGMYLWPLKHGLLIKGMQHTHTLPCAPELMLRTGSKFWGETLGRIIFPLWKALVLCLKCFWPTWNQGRRRGFIKLLR